MAILFLCPFLFRLQEKNNDRVLKIQVIKTDFRAEVITQIDCSNFESSFTLDTFNIYDSDKINKIIFFINKAQPYSIKNGIDARAKMYIYYQSNKIDSLCLENSEWFFFNNNPMIFADRSLIKMLDSLKHL